jgi:hypothetical protein
VVELTSLSVFTLPAPYGSDPAEDPGLVDAGSRPLGVVVALELQADVVTGGVVVSGGGVMRLLQTGGVESEAAETPAAWVLAASVAPADG